MHFGCVDLVEQHGSTRVGLLHFSFLYFFYYIDIATFISFHPMQPPSFFQNRRWFEIPTGPSDAPVAAATIRSGSARHTVRKTLRQNSRYATIVSALHASVE